MVIYNGAWARPGSSPTARGTGGALQSAAGNDAPLIGERAATRGRIATEGGDA
jgi:hypothetical protein